jgi:hypothetical protein
VGINDSGQISATGLVNGKVHALLLTPAAATPPHASLTSAPDVSGFGATSYSLVVTYTDNPGIDDTTVGNAITVKNTSSGFSQLATVVSETGPKQNLVVTYSITPPGGTWDFTDNGTYNIILANNVVKATNGTPLAGGTLGHFIVAVAPVRGSISGAVFNDANANGKQDAGEAGVANANVYLDLNFNSRFDSNDRLIQTDSNGNYTFGGLLPGAYDVQELVSAPHAVTSPANDVQSVLVGAGQAVTGVNFGDVTDPHIISIAGFPTLANVSGKTPQFDHQGDLLHIFGTGFEPGDVFFIGNDQSAMNPINLVAASHPDDVQSFGIRISPYATTGPLIVQRPNGRKVLLLTNVTIDSYRNTNGYSFVNDLQNQPDFSFDELAKVFGSDQTDITVDACGIFTLGLENCAVDTGIPDPLAYLELLLINEFMPPSNGLCLGFSLSSARLSLGLGQLQIGDFSSQAGTDGSTVWDLSGPSGPSPDLLQTIRLAHLEQSSDEHLENYLGVIAADEAFGPSHFTNGVKAQLNQGLPVLLEIQESGGGHAVLCYNVDDLPGGGERFDIYDPNQPFSSSEQGPANGLTLVNGSTHKADVDSSTIILDSSGNWNYDSGDSTGGIGSIAFAPLSVFDSHTLLSSSIEGLISKLLVFGNGKTTQVTDTSGHTLLNPNGTLNTNPATRIPNGAVYAGDPGSIPLDLVGGNGNFMQTIAGTGGGTYGAASLSSDAMAFITGVPTANGQTDRFGLNPANDMMSFVPGVTKPMTADLAVNAKGGAIRDAQLNAMVAGGGTEQLQFMGTNHDQIMLHNTGSAGMFSLTLTAAADGLVQSFSTGRMALAAGDTLNLTPTDWTGLNGATASAIVHHSNGTSTTMTLKNVGKGVNVAAKEAIVFSGRVATFSNVAPAGLKATIDWGDGSTSAGTVVSIAGGVAVNGSHKYAKQGYFPTRITLSDSTGQIGQATAKAAVADTKFALAPVSIAAFSGIPFSGRIATLSDLPSGDTASDFTVSINWGDGKTSAGTLQSTSAGHFDVRGTHTYATTGTRSVVNSVTETGTASAKGHTIKISSNKSFSGTVAQMFLPIPGSATSDYVASIDWGDGKKSSGKLVLQSDGSVIVSGSHTYAAAGSFATKVSITGGPSAKATSKAIVTLPLGTVTGTIFNDVNANFVRDTGETGLSGRTVFIDKNANGILNSGEPSAVTNAKGVYTIANAPAGNIRVTEVLPAGWRSDAPANAFFSVTLTPGKTISKLDFANSQLALLSGDVFLDSNGNKTQDTSEVGVPNRIVYIDSNNDGVREQSEPAAVTDASGNWAFNQVGPGTYIVRLVPVPSSRITTPAGGSFTFTVGHGSTRTKNNFGVKPVKLSFSGPKTFTTTGAKPVALAVADFNNDKKVDVATADSTGNDVTIFLGNGSGGFAAGKKIALGAGKNPIGIVAGDFNGDGKIDLAVANAASNQIQILLGAGNGTFKLQTTALTAAAPNGIAAANFNGDKTTDIVVSDKNSKQITLFLSKSGGGFAAGKTFAVGALPNAITIADVNGDGKADILVANANGNTTTNHGSVTALLGNGAGGFNGVGSFPALTGPASIAAADFDQDGHVDLIVANPGNNSGAILFGNGTGNFGPPSKITIAGTAGSVSSADLNGDGLPDAVFSTTGAGGNKIVVLGGKGDGSFAAPLSLTGGTAPQDVTAADLNGDGKLDLIAVARDDNHLIVLLNTTT